MNESFEIGASFCVALPRLWSCFTEPDHLRGWDPEEVDAPLAAGSRARFSWPSLDREIELDVVALEPQRRLVLRRVEEDVGSALEIEFSGRGEESSLVLRHATGAGGGQEGLAASWWSALTVLRTYAELYYDRQRRVDAASGVAPVDATRTFALLQLSLDTPGTRIAYSPPFDMVFHVAPHSTILRARAVPMTPGRTAVVVQVFGWDAPPDAFESVADRARGVVDRVCRSLGGDSGSR